MSVIRKFVRPGEADNEGGWQAFRERGLLLPLAYWDPIKCWTHLPAPTPAPDFPSLDAWLEAERKGELTDVPLYEPYGFTAINAAWYLGIIPKPEVQILLDRVSAAWAKHRRNAWPRVCCKCGAEFRTTDARQQWPKRARCATCRKQGVAT